MGRGVVPEFHDAWMAIQGRLHDAALHAVPASMNEADLAQSRCRSRFNVFGDDRWDVGRREGVEVQNRLNRNMDRLV